MVCLIISKSPILQFKKGYCCLSYECNPSHNKQLFRGIYILLGVLCLQEHSWCRTASCWWWEESHCSIWSWRWGSSTERGPSLAGGVWRPSSKVTSLQCILQVTALRNTIICSSFKFIFQD